MSALLAARSGDSIGTGSNLFAGIGLLEGILVGVLIGVLLVAATVVAVAAAPVVVGALLIGAAVAGGVAITAALGSAGEEFGEAKDRDLATSPPSDSKSSPDSKASDTDDSGGQPACRKGDQSSSGGLVVSYALHTYIGGPTETSGDGSLWHRIAKKLDVVAEVAGVVALGLTAAAAGAGGGLVLLGVAALGFGLSQGGGLLGQKIGAFIDRFEGDTDQRWEKLGGTVGSVAGGLLTGKVVRGAIEWGGGEGPVTDSPATSGGTVPADEEEFNRAFYNPDGSLRTSSEATTSAQEPVDGGQGSSSSDDTSSEFDRLFGKDGSGSATGGDESTTPYFQSVSDEGDSFNARYYDEDGTPKAAPNPEAQEPLPDATDPSSLSDTQRETLDAYNQENESGDAGQNVIAGKGRPLPYSGQDDIEASKEAGENIGADGVNYHAHGSPEGMGVYQGDDGARALAEDAISRDATYIRLWGCRTGSDASGRVVPFAQLVADWAARLGHPMAVQAPDGSPNIMGRGGIITVDPTDPGSSGKFKLFLPRESAIQSCTTCNGGGLPPAQAAVRSGSTSMDGVWEQNTGASAAGP